MYEERAAKLAELEYQRKINHDKQQNATMLSEWKASVQYWNAKYLSCPSLKLKIEWKSACCRNNIFQILNIFNFLIDLNRLYT